LIFWGQLIVCNQYVSPKLLITNADAFQRQGRIPGSIIAQNAC